MKMNEEQGDDWLDELSEEQQTSILRGLEQLDSGQGITHEEAIIRLGL
jgi:predicted transcriptional regulator